jgi:1-acyl-sn-glycerol-3-phosphate acyltransferase
LAIGCQHSAVSIQPAVASQISEAAQSGTLVVLFPEGGSSDGTSVLPFHSSLLEPAVALQLPIIPAHISYTLRTGIHESTSRTGER